jgi:hypothetical protein
MQDPDVCWNESQTWFKCVEQNSLSPKLFDETCQPQRLTFDECVQKWRSAVGPSVKLKGDNQGEPPLQCAAMSCLIATCIKKTNYDFDKCSQITRSFKHCVKGLYGSEYVAE